jgi:hypothetical protein
MKKPIQLLGTTLLVTGLGLGGSTLTAGAASAATGTQPVTVQPSSLDTTGHHRGDRDRCWWNDSWNTSWHRHHGDRDDCDNNRHHHRHHHDGKHRDW